MSTWRELITTHLKEHPDEEIIAITPGEEILDKDFDDGYGTSKGDAFTAWSQNRVFFPVVYDGAEWVESVPRDPCDEATAHVGGQ